MPKLIVLDYDGTLLDNLKLAEKAYAIACKKLGLKLRVQLLRRSFGLPTPRIIKRLFPRLSPQKREELIRLKQETFSNLLKKQLNTTPGANEFLRKAKKKFKLALVTSAPKKEVEWQMKRFEWKFDLILTAEDVREHKPSPAPFIEAMRRLKARRDKTLAIGDSVYDMIAAKRAGIKAIGLLMGFWKRKDLLKAGAWKVCKDLREVSSLLKL